MSGEVCVLYFAWLRERIGRGEERVALPASVTSAGALMDHLASLDDAHARALEQRHVIRCAVNQAIATAQTPIRPGDEIALFPPVTGG